MVNFNNIYYIRILISVLIYLDMPLRLYFRVESMFLLRK